MTYRERRERRVERLKEWAAGREAKAAAAFDRSHQLADSIPFGQPILAGHHSQRHAERDQERIHLGMRQGIEHSDKAKEHASRAGNIESALKSSIYSDDPGAADALAARIASLEADRDRIKRYNESARKGTPDESVLDDRQRAGLASVRKHAAYQLGKNGAFPAYALSNLNGSITRNRQRLESMRSTAKERGAGKPEAHEEPEQREPIPRPDHPEAIPAAHRLREAAHRRAIAFYTDDEGVVHPITVAS